MSDLSVVVSIIILEGLLSVDNALVNAGLANGLPRHQQKRAICFGISAGAVLRLVALFLVGWVVRFPIIKLIGGGYLVYLMVRQLCFAKSDHSHGTKNVVTLRSAIWSIACADIAFSLDNVVAAVGMSPKMIVVIIGVMAGIVTMLFATQLVVLLIRRYPMLEKTAYLIVGFIGLTIFGDELAHFQFSEYEKFSAIICAVVFTVALEEQKRFVLAGNAKRASQQKSCV